MNIFKKTSCIHCTKEFRKSEIRANGLCDNCFHFATFMYSVFIFEYKKILQITESRSNFDEIFSMYDSLLDFVQRELKPWYSYNCFPKNTHENIKTLQNIINKKIIVLVNSSLDDLVAKSKKPRRHLIKKNILYRTQELLK